MTDSALPDDSYTKDFRAVGVAGESVFARLYRQGQQTTLKLMGEWTLDNATALNKMMPSVHHKITADTLIDVAGITRLDTTGAVLVRRYSENIEHGTCSVVTGLTCPEKRLLDVITSVPPEAETEPEHVSYVVQLLTDIGVHMEHVLVSAGNLLGFIGLMLNRLIVMLLNPTKMRLAPIVHQFDLVGVRALGIVGLIAFLTGAVLVNQGSIQLKQFGAEILVIDMLGILQFRELGVLLASIIIAGRSGSSFTAQIGSMKLREEIDAMKTLGMNPIDVLVIPRLIALSMALPLLTFFSDIVGIAGGMLMAWGQLNIKPTTFISYFQTAITLDHFIVGMIKAPFNAAVIVVTGCYQGLAVQGSAESLGMNTTHSVVQAIFLVIVLDAFFAIFFSTIGL